MSSQKQKQNENDIFDARSENSSQDLNQKLCRICFAPQNNEENALPLKPNPDCSTDELLLKHLCKCKGSLKYVHHSCLVKWLKIKNIKFCELCRQEYDISYETCSLKDMMYRGFRYIRSVDNKRVLRVFLYFLYLWIFF